MIDPFAQRWPRPITWLAPDFGSFDREVRLNVLVHFHPTMLFLGNSRVQHGFDPNNPTLESHRVFDGAFVGGNPAEFLYFLRRAAPIDTLKFIIVGLDFPMLFPLPSATFNEIVIPTSGIHGVLDRLKILTSYVATSSSAKLVWRSLLGRPRYYDLNGHANDVVYQREIANSGGYSAANLYRETQFLENARLANEHFYQDLSDLVGWACDHDIVISVVLPPVHVRQLELTSIVGLWESFEAWKRKIVDISGERPNCPVQVWDFATHNAITTSEILGRDAAVPRTFWESAHFTVYVGNLVLAKIFDPEASALPANLGYVLAHDNVDRLLIAERDFQRDYERSHPEEFAELMYLARQVRPDLLPNRGIP